MISQTIVDPKKSKGLIFPQHKLAHKYLDGLNGIELGSAGE